MAIGSVKKFYALETGLDFPRLVDKRVFAGVSGRYENYPHIDYYGEGPNSSKAGRTAYALEDTSFLGKAGIRPLEHLNIGLLGRYWLVNVGPSTDHRFAPTEQVYSEAQAPGITKQTNYLIGGGFVQYDNRDIPGNPHGGGNYIAQFTVWSDRKLETGSFNRLDLEAQQYFSFLNSRRVIALRWRTAFTEPGAGQVVPFYAQPTLGGPDDLRGFRAYRFYDRNSLVMNAEYRWEVANGVDAAIFADAGKVFHRWQDIDLSGLESSFGFGVRTNIKGRSFGRVDVGFSHEGFQVWLKFGNIF
jgi:outer membrane protein assembly factor BamA